MKKSVPSLSRWHNEPIGHAWSPMVSANRENIHNIITKGARAHLEPHSAAINYSPNCVHLPAFSLPKQQKLCRMGRFRQLVSLAVSIDAACEMPYKQKINKQSCTEVHFSSQCMDILIIICNLTFPWSFTWQLPIFSMKTRNLFLRGSFCTLRHLKNRIICRFI